MVNCCEENVFGKSVHPSRKCFVCGAFVRRRICQMKIGNRHTKCTENGVKWQKMFTILIKFIWLKCVRRVCGISFKHFLIAIGQLHDTIEHIRWRVLCLCVCVCFHPHRVQSVVATWATIIMDLNMAAPISCATIHIFFFFVCLVLCAFFSWSVVENPRFFEWWQSKQFRAISHSVRLQISGTCSGCVLKVMRAPIHCYLSGTPKHCNFPILSQEKCTADGVQIQCSLDYFQCLNKLLQFTNLTHSHRPSNIHIHLERQLNRSAVILLKTFICTPKKKNAEEKDGEEERN